jgi:hypothetical protein
MRPLRPTSHWVPLPAFRHLRVWPDSNGVPKLLEPRSVSAVSLGLDGGGLGDASQ